MSIQPTCLVLADISGYTHFVRQPQLSLLHAEEIITELLEAVIDGAANPLHLNKLEGDAALMFARYDGPAAVQDVVNQAERFFGIFRARRAQLIAAGHGGCGCEACTGIARLHLKIVVHTGDVLLKKIRQFEELAGEPVILAHRLLKNSIVADEYLLLTEITRSLIGKAPGEARTEHCEDFGPQAVHAYYPEHASARNHAGANALMAKLQAMRLSLRARWHRLVRPGRRYRHLAQS